MKQPLSMAMEGSYPQGSGNHGQSIGNYVHVSAVGVRGADQRGKRILGFHLRMPHKLMAIEIGPGIDAHGLIRASEINTKGLLGGHNGEQMPGFESPLGKSLLECYLS